MKKRAYIFYGGWDGHQPGPVSELFEGILREEGFEVDRDDNMDGLDDLNWLKELNLIVPVWTMGQLTPDQQNNICAAVREHGVGIAGCHGGMCDAFRNACEYQFMTGGQWVAHPGNDGVRYLVKIIDKNHEIMKGLSDFEVASEQYLMHVDPSNDVLATTKFPVADGPHVRNGEFEMPVVWTRCYGKGNVFYNSLGHQVNILEAEPCKTIMRRGFLWAAKK